VAELPKTQTKSFGMVGVTWSPATTESDIKVEIRSLALGVWSQWQSVEQEDANPGVAGRPGTEPIWVGKAQGVSVRVLSKSGTKPADIKVVTIDPGNSGSSVTPAAYHSNATFDGTVRASSIATTTGDGTPAFTPRPAIISRSAWGASAGTTCSAPLTGNSTHGVVIHHTAGNNTYSKSDSAKIVRGIQAYHVKGHGWCDIGYNFLVDRFGQIFEGRKGGTDRPVRAAHSGNAEVNTYDMGVSMMGNYDKVVPSTALKDSMVKLVGWRMGTNYMHAKGTYYVGEKLTSKNDQIDSHHLNMISGHRNVISDVCPGRYGYIWLTQKGGLRDRVEAYMSKYASDIKTRAASLGVATTGPVFVGEAVTNGGRKTRFGKLDMYFKTGAGARTVTAAGGFRTAYKSLKSELSPLGFPKSDSPVVGTSGTFVQRFENGTIFAMRSGSTTTTHALWGPIAQTYKRLNEAAGKLGVPRSSVQAVSGGSRANFAKGYVIYTASTKKTVAYDSSGKTISSSPPPAATADTVTVPSSRVFALKGHGFGHGIGMSQYGAQGAASGGKTFAQILAFYYPGTALTTKSSNIRVLITRDTTVSVIVAGRSGLTFRKISDSKTTSLPTSVGAKTVKQWRIMPLSSDKRKSTLQFRTDNSWTTFANTVWTGDAQFAASRLKLFLPDGSGVTYRGALRSAVPKAGSTDRNTVNVLPLDSYVLGVVSAEMPSGWKPEALKAQAIAARTYASRSMSATRYYDLCDTSSCQVYRGVSGERTSTNAAVSATARKILIYAGKPAFTQFSASSGGWTAMGSQPYLTAKVDPYDAFNNPNHDWSTTVKASTLEKAYPAIGTLTSLKVTNREGGGDWGGRVTTVSLIGSKSTVAVSGPTMRGKLGLRSAWFRFN